MDEIEGVGPGGVAALLAAPAQLIEADRGERPDQREAGGHGIEQREDVVSECRPRDEHAGNRVYQADKDGMGGHRPEVVEALLERLDEIARCDRAHARQAVRVGGADCVLIRHGHFPPERLRSSGHDLREPWSRELGSDGNHAEPRPAGSER